jgi:hypothetical protein
MLLTVRVLRYTVVTSAPRILRPTSCIRKLKWELHIAARLSETNTWYYKQMKESCSNSDTNPVIFCTILTVQACRSVSYVVTLIPCCFVKITARNMNETWTTTKCGGSIEGYHVALHLSHCHYNHLPHCMRKFSFKMTGVIDFQIQHNTFQTIPLVKVLCSKTTRLIPNGHA